MGEKIKLEEAIKAIAIIKKFCAETGCSGCPLSTKKELGVYYCTCSSTTPKRWKIQMGKPARQENSCKGCRWWEPLCAVCCKSDSTRCADFWDGGCEKWEQKEREE